MAEPQGKVADGVDAALYPVAVLIDELRHDDLQLRLNSVRNLSTIATALGAERTREELLPFLQEIVDDEDEVLIALAEQLGRGVSWVGGPAHVHALIGPLEELCSVEEMSVRDRAVEALREVTGQMSSDQVSRHVCALITRLVAHEWFTSRISACNLFVAAVPKVGDSKQDDLLKAYSRLCADDAPLVRRQAANVLGNVAEVVRPGVPFQEIMDVFVKLSKDEQDSVRILTINNCISLGKLNRNTEGVARIMEIVRNCAEDKSWRVRYMVADHMKSLCSVFESEAMTTMVPLYLKLLVDPEAEVRTIAVVRIAEVSAFGPTQAFLEELMPVMEKLTHPNEHSQHVRASFAGSVLGLTPIFGATLTADYLISIFLRLIRDENPEVRLKLISSLGELSSVVCVDVLSQSLLPSIKELGNDRQWRVRLAIINSMPSLAKYLGEQQFTTELSGLIATWILDPVFSVRDAAAVNCRSLTELLGADWSQANIVPKLNATISHQNYLYRISATLCTGMVAEVSQGQLLEHHLAPMAVQLASDPVPNVRFNAAKAMKSMWRSCSSSCPTVAESTLLPCLRSLLDDPDPDVRYFAEQAIRESEASK